MKSLTNSEGNLEKSSADSSLLAELMKKSQEDYNFKGMHSQDSYKNSGGTKGVHSREKNKLVSVCEDVFGSEPSLDTIEKSLLRANLTNGKLELAQSLFAQIKKVIVEKSQEFSESEDSIYEILEDYKGAPNQLYNLGALAELISPRAVDKLVVVGETAPEFEAISYRVVRAVKKSTDTK